MQGGPLYLAESEVVARLRGRVPVQLEDAHLRDAGEMWGRYGGGTSVGDAACERITYTVVWVLLFSTITLLHSLKALNCAMKMTMASPLTTVRRTASRASRAMRTGRTLWQRRAPGLRRLLTPES